MLICWWNWPTGQSTARTARSTHVCLQNARRRPWPGGQSNWLGALVEQHAMSEHWADVPGAHLSGLGLEKDNSRHVGRRRGLFLGGLVSMALFPGGAMFSTNSCHISTNQHINSQMWTLRTVFGVMNVALMQPVRVGQRSKQAVWISAIVAWRWIFHGYLLVMVIK